MPSRTCIVTLLAGALLAAACAKEEQTPFVYTDGQPADPAAPPAAQAPVTVTVATAKPGVPPAGDPAAHKSPDFYLPSDAELTATSSGLKYLVLREGSGTSPTREGNFTAHYCGWFTNGEKFDSSYDDGQPLTYPVMRMIKGWQEALVMMKPGAEYLLVVPPELGYGAGGNGIPPNSTLVFRMELLSVSG